jgi:hypothetical protein
MKPFYGRCMAFPAGRTSRRHRRNAVCEQPKACERIPPALTRNAQKHNGEELEGSHSQSP